MPDSLFAFKKQLEGDNIIFCYRGAMARKMTTEIGETLKSQAELRRKGLATRINAFSIFVELAQNILGDSKVNITQIDLKNEGLYGGIILLGRQKDNYYLHCGDFIENEEVKGLEETLNRLKRINKEELKEYYKSQRKKPLDTYSQKAEFSLIEMARRSIDISFASTPVDDKFSFFSIKVFF